MTRNKCDAYCKLRPGLGYLLLDCLFGGHGADFYSGIAYRIDFGYDTPIAGVIDVVFIRNGRKTVCLSIKEFREHFVLIKKLS